MVILARPCSKGRGAENPEEACGGLLHCSHLRSQLAVQVTQARKVVTVLPRPSAQASDQMSCWDGWVADCSAGGQSPACGPLQQPVQSHVANRQVHYIPRPLALAEVTPDAVPGVQLTSASWLQGTACWLLAIGSR